MHITIYGLTTEDEFTYLTESDLDEDTYAADHYDYWRDYEETDELIAKELANLFGGFEHNGIEYHFDDPGWYLTFTQEAIDRYFRDQHHAFWNAVCNLLKITEPEMMKAFYIPALTAAQNAFSDSTGCMIYSMTDGWMTPQDFMRFVKPGTRYYITGALDAHA